MAEPAIPLFRALAMPGRKPRGEWQLDAITIGTRSTCALVLNDPVAANEHCRIVRRDGAFLLEDRGSVTGTWHNGAAVKGPVPLASGDRIVLGVSRLVVELKSEDGRPVLELALEEASFHYKRAKPGEFRSDADEWVRSEVRFGRVPAVRALAWLAGLVGTLGTAIVLSTGAGERFLQPGRLDGTHAALFAGDPASHVPEAISRKASFAASVERVRHESCRVCHADGDPGDVASCTTCHQELAHRHPFLAGAAGSSESTAEGLRQPADACRMCHAVDHDGASPEQSLAEARRRVDDPPDSPRGDVCLACHAQGLPSTSEAIERIEELARAHIAPGEAAAKDFHAYGFDEFSHASHVGSAGLACTVCHVRDAGSASAQDFAAASFEACAACHVEGLEAPRSLPGFDEAALVAMRERLAKQGQLVRLSWHGRGERCFDCHARGAEGEVSPALATAERRVTQASFEFERLDHGPHAAKPGSAADCRRCHADARTLDDRGRTRAPFFHGAHVESLRLDDPKRAAAREAECLGCHGKQWEAKTLEASTRVDFPEACTPCHVAGSDGAPPARLEERTETRTSTRFSHAAHRVKDAQGKLAEGTLAGGCFACHGFAGADDEDPRALPVLLDGVADCTRCHGEHRNIAGDACSFCHPARPQGVEGHANLFRGERPSRMDWPSGFQFAHFSGTAERGHASYVLEGGAHAGSGADQGCLACHDRAGLVGAKRVGDVPIPDARGWMCVECHANQRGWFHWSLPDPRRTAR